MKIRFFLTAIVIVIAGCTPQTSAPSITSSTSPTLPASWYNHSASKDDKMEEPSPEFGKSVHDTLKAHTDALAQASATSPQITSTLSSHPSDWTPWHLDGMIADFAIDVDGLFGDLVGSGTYSVKGTWQQQQKNKPASILKTKSNGIQFSAKLSEKDIQQMLEPTIRSAVATGNIKNEQVFRKNLQAQASQFVSVGKTLDALPVLPGWHVDGYQLQLTFNAQGQVTPFTAVGAAVNIFFDWQKSAVASSVKVPPASPSALYLGMNAINQVVGPLISEVRNESEDLIDCGFDFDEFQLGIAITAGGDVGIAQLQGTATGKILYKIDGEVPQKHTSLTVAAAREKQNKVDKLALSAPEPVIKFIGIADEAHQSAAKLGTIHLQSLSTDSDENQDKFAYEVTRSKFKQGLARALHMGAYFAEKAQDVDTSPWRVVQMETEFDAGLTGDLTFVNAGIVGQIVLDFDRVSN